MRAVPPAELLYVQDVDDGNDHMTMRWLLDSVNGNLELDPTDLKSLVRRQRVQVDCLTHGRSQVRLTNHGRSFLDTIAKRC